LIFGHTAQRRVLTRLNNAAESPDFLLHDTVESFDMLNNAPESFYYSLQDTADNSDSGEECSGKFGFSRFMTQWRVLMRLDKAVESSDFLLYFTAIISNSP
jgi:hypothetical protein